MFTGISPFKPILVFGSFEDPRECVRERSSDCGLTCFKFRKRQALQAIYSRQIGALGMTYFGVIPFSSFVKSEESRVIEGMVSYLPLLPGWKGPSQYKSLFCLLTCPRKFRIVYWRGQLIQKALEVTGEVAVLRPALESY